MDNATNHSITIQCSNYFAALAWQESGVLHKQQIHSIYNSRNVNAYLMDINSGMKAFSKMKNMRTKVLQIKD